MNILIDKLYKTVAAVNSAAPSPFQFLMTVNDNCTVSIPKTVQQGDIQKTDENGNPLFHKDIYKIEDLEVVIGQFETTEITDTPIMISVQKTNNAGEALYTLMIPSEDDESIFSAEETTESEDGNGNPLNPIMVQVQKLNSKGKKLYLKDNIEIQPTEVFDHTEETTENTGVPIMIPNMVNIVATFTDNYQYLTLDDVVNAKYQYLLDDSNMDYITGNVFTDESEINFTYDKHSANTGSFICEIHPGGSIKTKELELAVTAKTFKLAELEASGGIKVLINDVEFIDGVATLDSLVNNVTLTFINTEDKCNNLVSYAILYNEE